MSKLNMDNKINEFKKQFAACRERGGLTYRAMEKATGIKYSALAAIQGGNRPCGEHTARRIASAFGLSGDVCEAFVLSALNTSRERVLETVKEYPSEVLNLLGLLLMAQGIEARQIIGCGFDPLAPNHLQISLKGSRAAHLHVTLSGSL